jgi:hypothetical protein
MYHLKVNLIFWVLKLTPKKFVYNKLYVFIIKHMAMKLNDKLVIFYRSDTRLKIINKPIKLLKILDGCNNELISYYNYVVEYYNENYIKQYNKLFNLKEH